MTTGRKATLGLLVAAAIACAVAAFVLLGDSPSADLERLQKRYLAEWNEPNDILARMAAHGPEAGPYLAALARQANRRAPMDWLTMVPGTEAEKAYARLIPWLLGDVHRCIELKDWERVPGVDAYRGSLGKMTERNPMIWGWVLDSLLKDRISLPPEFDESVARWAITMLAFLPATPERFELLLRWNKAVRGRLVYDTWQMTGDVKLGAAFLLADWVETYGGSLEIGDRSDGKSELLELILYLRDGTKTPADLFKAELGLAEWHAEPDTLDYTEEDLKLVAEWLGSHQDLFAIEQERDAKGHPTAPPKVILAPPK